MKISEDIKAGDRVCCIFRDKLVGFGVYIKDVNLISNFGIVDAEEVLLDEGKTIYCWKPICYPEDEGKKILEGKEIIMITMKEIGELY